MNPQDTCRGVDFHIDVMSCLPLNEELQADVLALSWCWASVARVW